MVISDRQVKYPTNKENTSRTKKIHHELRKYLTNEKIPDQWGNAWQMW